MPALGGLMLVGALGLGAASDSARDRYDLDFRDSASAIARIEARVTVLDGALYVEAYTTQQPGFWRSLIHGLSARDSAGKTLAIDSLTPLAWRIGEGYRGRATLTYTVDYSFARRPFPSGNQKGGFIADGAVYLVTR